MDAATREQLDLIKAIMRDVVLFAEIGDKRLSSALSTLSQVAKDTAKQTKHTAHRSTP